MGGYQRTWCHVHVTSVLVSLALTEKGMTWTLSESSNKTCKKVSANSILKAKRTKLGCPRGVPIVHQYLPLGKMDTSPYILLFYVVSSIVYDSREQLVRMSLKYTIPVELY